MYKTITLNNGLRVAINPMQGMESVAAGLWIGVGGRYENKDNAGVSHFLEHLLFKGTKRRSARQIKEEIEGKGGSLNGFTSEEFTCYMAKVPARHINSCVDLLCDMVLNARLDALDIKRERTVILEEIRLYKDLPNHYVHELLNALLWPGQPLGMLLSGTFESVRSIDREDICRHKEKFYAPSNIVLSIAGNISEAKDLVKQIDSLFSDKTGAVIPEFVTAKEQKDGVKTNLFFKQTEQAHLCLGTYAPFRDHPDRYAVGLLHVILGANMSSRLFHEVREKRGLAYEIGSHIIRHKDTGAFIVDAGCRPDKTTETIEVILKELKKIKHSTVSKNEFQRTKEYYTGQLLLALEETQDHMMWLGENLIASDRLYTKREVLKSIDSVSPYDIKRIANSIFSTDTLKLALIGPIKDKEKNDILNILELE